MLTWTSASIALDGLSTLAREEGFRGMSKGMTLALIGVSNGAIQFMTYEELKKRRVELRRKRIGAGASDEEIKRLVRVRCRHGMGADRGISGC